MIIRIVQSKGDKDRHVMLPPDFNRRLVAAYDGAVAFRWKDYRREGSDRWKTMTFHPHEFIRRFLMHVLPKGFHRIRHYGLFANGNRAANMARLRELLRVGTVVQESQEEASSDDQPQFKNSDAGLQRK